jgi:hypothetical protein
VNGRAVRDSRRDPWCAGRGRSPAAPSPTWPDGLAVAPTATGYALQGELRAAQGRGPDARGAFDAASRMKIEHGNSVAVDGRTFDGS